MEKWKKGMLVGAALGLLVSLIDRQEREKVKDYSRNMKNEVLPSVFTTITSHHAITNKVT